MSNSFSQIPTQVLNKARRKGLVRNEVKKKKVKFTEEDYLPPIVIDDDSTTDYSDRQEEVDFAASDPNEPTSSKVEPPKAIRETFDAIVQTDQKRMIDRATQTDESLKTRPLNSTYDDLHRLSMQSHYPIMPIPRRRPGFEPPLKIGLTLRGKKRKVFYPDDSNSATGA